MSTESIGGRESILEDLFLSTVKINVKTTGGKSMSGTGFVYAHPQGGAFLVTVRHLVADVADVRFLFLLANALGRPRTGVGAEAEVAPEDFHFPADSETDLAVASLTKTFRALKAAGEMTKISATGAGNVPSPDAIRDLELVQTVIVVGYPMGIIDQENLTPVVRRGVTATPYHLDFNGRREFLIDAEIVEGSSGSPVYAYDGPGYRTGTGDAERLESGERALLLGAVSAYRTAETYRRSIGLGVVTKASVVAETIEECIAARCHWSPSQ